MKVFGIKAIRVNDCVVHTYNVMVKNCYANAVIINQNGLEAIKAGRNDNRLKLTFTSLDVQEFNDKVIKLGKVLKQIAQTNLDNKYHWVK